MDAFGTGVLIGIVGGYVTTFTAGYTHEFVRKIYFYSEQRLTLRTDRILQECSR